MSESVKAPPHEQDGPTVIRRKGAIESREAPWPGLVNSRRRPNNRLASSHGDRTKEKTLPGLLGQAALEGFRFLRVPRTASTITDAKAAPMTSPSASVVNEVGVIDVLAGVTDSAESDGMAVGR
jgi:hypothetical protein